MYLVKTPDVLKPLAKDFVWNKSRDEKTVYLTFDDGPTPQITGEILEILKRFDARATFFCIGGNVAKNKKTFESILTNGHRVANHTWNHMNGWKFSDYSYFKSVLECAEVVDSNLFRPPYGRITQSQAKGLKGRFEIIMWDVLSADWRADVSPEQCLTNVMNHTREGSIIVFHDSEKAYKNMIYALPRCIERLKEKGYSFGIL
jgi:peptidoglycan/xylan/chitin deacetylase (PgdA/CDA1 family)